MKFIIKASALFLAVFLSGCATIVSDSTYPVAINTNPEGATFSITNRAGMKIQTGRTPSLLNLRAKRGFFSGETYTVTVEKEGYDPKTFEVDSKLDGWYFGNIIFGGLIGMLIVDPASGSMWKLPENNMVTLDSVVASTNDTPALNVVTIDQIPEEQRKDLVKVQ